VQSDARIPFPTEARNVPQADVYSIIEGRAGNANGCGNELIDEFYVNLPIPPLTRFSMRLLCRDRGRTVVVAVKRINWAGANSLFPGH